MIGKAANMAYIQKVTLYVVLKNRSVGQWIYSVSMTHTGTFLGSKCIIEHTPRGTSVLFRSHVQCLHLTRQSTLE